MTQASLNFSLSIFISMHRHPPIYLILICLFIEIHKVHEISLNVTQDSVLLAAAPLIDPPHWWWLETQVVWISAVELFSVLFMVPCEHGWPAEADHAIYDTSKWTLVIKHLNVTITSYKLSSSDSVLNKTDFSEKPNKHWCVTSPKICHSK